MNTSSPRTITSRVEKGSNGAYLRSSTSATLLACPSSVSEDDSSFDSINSHDNRLMVDVGSSDVKGPTELDVALYMAKREMTPLQERVNAITMIPNVVYCIYFLFSGAWLSQQLIEQTMNAMSRSDYEKAQYEGVLGGLWTDDQGCVSSSLFPYLYALPPLPVIIGAAGIMIHAPFSFLYHWQYAHRLPPGYARTDHWSRRMDHAMIHFASICMSYATSGNWRYFWINAAFNADCMYRQFEREVRPRRNQRRIAISILLYTFPILQRGEWELFLKLWLMFGVGGWLFAAYPVGGWSHSAFHVVLSLLPPLILTSALDLSSSRAQLEVAAQCAAMSKIPLR